MNEPRRTVIEVDLRSPHPNMRLQLTNKPVWTTNPDDGTPAHATVPPAVLSELYGPEANVSIKDYEASLVLQLGEDDFLDDQEALSHATEPTAEEIDEVAGTVELPGDFDSIFKEETGAAPTEEDRLASKRATAKGRILDRGGHMLLGLTEAVIQAIKAKKVDVVVMRRKCKAGLTRRMKRTIDLQDLVRVVEKGRINMYRHWDTDPVRYLTLTAALDEDASFRGIAFVEMPVRDRRGLVIVFPMEFLTEALITKNTWIVRVFPALLDMHPAMRWKPSRRRGSGRHREDRRRWHDAEAEAPEPAIDDEGEDDSDEDDSDEGTGDAAPESASA